MAFAAWSFAARFRRTVLPTGFVVLPLVAFFCGMLLTAALVAQPESELLTLERAIELAEQNSLQLAGADARQEVAAARVEEVGGYRLPQLHLEAGYQRTDNPVLVFGTKLLQNRFSLEDFEIGALNSPDPIDDWSARLVLQQSLWSGGRVGGGREAATATASASIAERERVRQELVREVTDRHSGAALADYALSAARASLETAQANVRLVRDLYESGLVVESDLLLAGVRESEVEELVVRAEAALEVTSAALNLSLGRDQATPIRLPSEPIAAEDAVAPERSVAELVELALERRPDLEAARHYRAASAGQVRAIRGGRRPELGLMASFETHGEDFFGNDGNNATLGVGLSVPLFEGNITKARVVASEAKLREADYRAALLAQRVELEVRQRLADLGAAGKRLTLALRGLELAERSLAVVEDRYRHGLTTLVDLLEAESALTQSRVREVSARRDLLLARVGLDLATASL